MGTKDYQPNSYHCFVCGLKNEAGLHIRFQNDGPGRVKVETQICDQHQGYPGIAHGGVIAAILDETMGRAGISGENGTEDRFLYTAKMEIRYRVPVPLNTDIVIRGRLIKDKKRAALAEGEVILPDGRVAVEGTATLMEMPQAELDALFENYDLGWRVYDDDEIENFNE